MNSMPPILISQSFSSGEVPADEGQKNRLMAALKWNYEFTFMYELADLPGITISYDSNDASSDEFTITSSAENGSVTLTAVRLGNTRPMTMIEILPADNTEVEVVVLEPDRRVIRFKHEDDRLTLDIKVSGLNILDVRSANARVEIAELPPSQFVGPVFPFLQREEVFRFDKLTSNRDLESLIATLFSVLFEGAGNMEFGLACKYGYSLEPSLPEVVVPVILLPPANSEDHKNIAANLAEGIKRWWADFTPKPWGTFNFEISADSTAAAEKQTLFRFSRIVLPSEAVSDLPGA